MVFMFGTYFFKFQPTTIDAELQLQDNNVWNDKNTMDALQFLQHEVFTFCFIFANLTTDILIAFTNVSNIDAFGKSNTMSLLALGLLVFDKSLSLLQQVYRMAYATGQNLVFTVGNVALLVLRVLILSGIVILYFLEGRFDGENLAHKL